MRSPTRPWNQQKFIKRMVAEIMRKEQRKKRVKLVDVGCGRGRELLHFATRKIEAVGVDISINALHQVLELRNRTKLYNISLIRGSAPRLPFKDAFSDIVVCSFLLTFLSPRELKGTVEELNRILCKEGTLFLTVFSTKDPLFAKGRIIDRQTFLVYGEPIHFFTRKEIETLLDPQYLSMKLLRHITFLDMSHGYPHTHRVWFLIADKTR